MLLASTAFAQKVLKVEWTTVYGEEDVPEYTLPDPFMCQDGTPVTSVEQWENVRRPELLELLTTYMYGRTPEVKTPFGYEVLAYEPRFYGGLAKR